MVQPVPVAKGAYRFEKIFSDGDYMAGGILEIPVGSKKPIKPAKDNSYVRPSPLSSLSSPCEPTRRCSTSSEASCKSWYIAPTSRSPREASSLFREVRPPPSLQLEMLIKDARTGNSYEIENIGQIPCRLVFAQAREVKIAVDAMGSDEEYGPGMEGDASLFMPPVIEEDEEELLQSE